MEVSMFAHHHISFLFLFPTACQLLKEETQGEKEKEDGGDSSAVESTDKHSPQHEHQGWDRKEAKSEWGQKEGQEKGGQGNDGGGEEVLFLQIDVNHKRESRNSEQQ